VADDSGIGQRRASARDTGNPLYLERRRELIHAAAKVFKARGLSGTKIADITAAADTDRSTLYYYFSSKEELFQEVVRDAVVANLVEARAIYAADRSAIDKLRALMTSLISSYERHYPIIYVFIQENLSHQPGKRTEWANDMRKVNKEYETILVQIIQDGYDSGEMTEAGPAWLTAYGIMGMMGWTNRWFDPATSAANAAEIATTFANMTIQGLSSNTDRPT